MPEGNHCAAHDKDQCLDALWTTQTNAVKQLENLSIEFFCFAMEMRREIQSSRLDNGANPNPRQPAPVIISAVAAAERVLRRNPNLFPEPSDLGDYYKTTRNF